MRRNLYGEASVAAVQAALQTRLLNWYVNTSGIAPMDKDGRDPPPYYPTPSFAVDERVAPRPLGRIRGHEDLCSQDHPRSRESHLAARATVGYAKRPLAAAPRPLPRPCGTWVTCRSTPSMSSRGRITTSCTRGFPTTGRSTSTRRRRWSAVFSSIGPMRSHISRWRTSGTTYARCAKAPGRTGAGSLP